GVDLEHPWPSLAVQAQLHVEGAVGAQVLLDRAAGLLHRLVAAGHRVLGDALLEHDLLGHHGLDPSVTPGDDGDGVLGASDALLHDEFLGAVTALGHDACHLLRGADEGHSAAAAPAAGFDHEPFGGSVGGLYGPFGDRPGARHPDPGHV